MAAALESQLGETRDVLQRFDAGLTVEARFPISMAHLPFVFLIHGLDQTQFPKDSDVTYQVPDYQMLFRRLAASREHRPCLVEVKSVDASRRSVAVSRDRMDATKRYANAVAQPLIYAVFWQRTSAWTLHTADQFKLSRRTARLALDDALTLDISALFGDDYLVFQPPIVRRTTYDTQVHTDRHIYHDTMGFIVHDEISLDGNQFTEVTEVETGILLSVLPNKIVDKRREGVRTVVVTRSDAVAYIKFSTVLCRLQYWFGTLDSPEQTLVALGTAIRFGHRLNVDRRTLLPQRITPEFNELVFATLGARIQTDAG